MKLKFSALLSDVRGKLNGSYASRDLSGNVLRNRTIPFNRSTSLQTSSRNIFLYVATLWGRISQQCKDDWARYAKTKPYTDQFADERTMSGYAIFMQSNINLHQAGFPLIECPSFDNSEFPVFNISVPQPSKKYLFLTMEPSPKPDRRYLFYARLVKQGSQEKKDKDFVFLYSAEQSDFDNGTINLAQYYEPIFGDIKEGDVIEIGMRQALPNGRVSTMRTNSIIASEPAPFVTGIGFVEVVGPNDILLKVDITNLEYLDNDNYDLIEYTDEGIETCPFDKAPNIVETTNYNRYDGYITIRMLFNDALKGCYRYGFTTKNTHNGKETPYVYFVYNPYGKPEA